MTNRRPKTDGTWEDCGCPLSLAHLESFQQDLSTGPHICLISRDEWRKHYILDRHAYVRACREPQDSTFGVWVAERLKEGRLFVAKPPQRQPVPPEPWRFDEPTFWDLTPSLEPGWRLWQPEDDALHFGGDTTELMYDRMLDDFFELLHLEGLMKKLMLESGEAWLLSCGEPNQNVRMNSRACLKNDRCFVTADNEFFACITQVLTNGNMRNSVAELLKYVDLGLWMKHMRRIADIRIDANVKKGGCGHIFNFI
ncbi:hypothetical protein M758_11G155100 [Ceratodon purpureus]|nr:hypothetical protein M758_11G155100 [Ceratodon purpureus]